jgi:hypothetical protein
LVSKLALPITFLYVDSDMGFGTPLSPYAFSVERNTSLLSQTEVFKTHQERSAFSCGFQEVACARCGVDDLILRHTGERHEEGRLLPTSATQGP